MELVTIRIKGLCNTSRYGALSSGDLLRTDAAFARHLVEDIAAAEYVKQKPVPPAKRPARKPRKES